MWIKSLYPLIYKPSISAGLGNIKILPLQSLQLPTLKMQARHLHSHYVEVSAYNFTYNTNTELKLLTRASQWSPKALIQYSVSTRTGGTIGIKTHPHRHVKASGLVVTGELSPYFLILSWAKSCWGCHLQLAPKECPDRRLGLGAGKDSKGKWRNRSAPKVDIAKGEDRRTHGARKSSDGSDVFVLNWRSTSLKGVNRRALPRDRSWEGLVPKGWTKETRNRRPKGSRSEESDHGAREGRKHVESWVRRVRRAGDL